MTLEQAILLHRRWFGTAETRKPPTDEQLRRFLAVDRATWDECQRVVAERRAGRLYVFPTLTRSP